jgi:hypothetical protein
LLCELTQALANTIYKFYIKLIKYDIICKTFIETTKKIKKSKYYIVDTTLICNKGGIDNVGYNIQLPKHKTTKISIISNENKILDVQLCYNKEYYYNINYHFFIK